MRSILLFDIPCYHPDGFKHIGDGKIRLYDPVTAVVAADAGAGAAAAATVVDAAGVAAGVDAAAGVATDATAATGATAGGVTQVAADAAGTGELAAAPEATSNLAVDQVSALQPQPVDYSISPTDGSSPVGQMSMNSLNNALSPNYIPQGLQISGAVAPASNLFGATMGGAQGLTADLSTLPAVNAMDAGVAPGVGTLSQEGVTSSISNAVTDPLAATPSSIPNYLKTTALNKAISTMTKPFAATTTGTRSPLSSSSSGQSNNMTSSSTNYKTPGTLTGTALTGGAVFNSNPQIIAKLKQMYPQLSSVDPRILDSIANGQQQQQQQQGSALMSAGVNAMGSAGTSNPYSSMLQTSLAASGGANPTPDLPIAKEGGGTLDIIKKWQDKQNQQEGSQLMGQGLKMVGATAYAKDGGHAHVPEFITGATGHYVKGKGDGQSDDIPAMLADGEYVFDADTVASLGNGSSDAGAKLLDHFREALREHKRSAPVDKIPPASSPLLYMKEALKRHKKG